MNTLLNGVLIYFFSLIGLVIFSPVFVVLAVLIFIDDGRPIFFSQKRYGKNKRIFTIWKFRSMKNIAPANCATNALEKPDFWITSAGKWLRRTSLDELPQLWNIFVGDMSIVGPRPVILSEVNLILQRDLYDANRLRPGLTGWAQINGRDEVNDYEKARLDGEYAKVISILFDLKIFFLTIINVIFEKGVHEGKFDMHSQQFDMTQSSPLKVLFVANTGRFYHFEKKNMELLRNRGIEVHFAANFTATPLDNIHPEGIILHQLECTRQPFSFANIYAYKNLKKLITDEKFDMVHCHTPVGGVLARLASYNQRKLGMKVIYSAHGFHFYKGAPLKYWLLFYPVEWILSWITDVIITINKEDYRRAYKHFHAKELYYIPGIGIDVKDFSPQIIDITHKRQSLGVGPHDIMFLAVGELNSNKNHEILIKAISNIKNAHIKCFIAGRGELKSRLQQLIHEYHVEKSVFIIGFRKDLSTIYQCADAFLFPSKREGLSAALMEAMASGLPVICSDIRGNNDLIDNGFGGHRVSPNDFEQWSKAMKELINKKELWPKYGEYNRNKILNVFSRSVVENQIEKVYFTQLYKKASACYSCNDIS
jgi:glycosyltransferase EpsD